jgi:hypothetical protein
MKLQGTDVEKLANAMLEAYPDRTDLEMMVKYKLDQSLDEIAGGETTRYIIFNLIKWADSNGRIRDLLNATSEYRPHNSDLKEAINNLLITVGWINLLNDSSLSLLHPLIKELRNEFDLTTSQKIISTFESITSLENISEVLEKFRYEFNNIDPSIEGKYLQNFCQSKEITEEIGCEINIVLLVMNQSEAEKLDSENVFSDYNTELRRNFQILKQTLANNGVIDWVNHYQSTSEQWQPFNQDIPQKNITQLIEEVIEYIRPRPKIVSKFIDIRELNQYNHSSFKLLQQLRHEGCIIIMDVISMQHPEMQHLFKSTALDAFPNTLVLMVAPIYSVFDIVTSIKGVIEQRIDIEFYRRLELNDSKCMKISDKTIFRNWLIGKVPDLLSVSETKNVSDKPWGHFGKGGSN